MSFPDETVKIKPDEISRLDFLIEDRLLAAMQSNAAVILENTAAQQTTVTFYSKLIDSLSDNVQKRQTETGTKWTIERLRSAAEKIVSNVEQQKQNRRFIWKRLLPMPHCIHLNRQSTINKIANDVHCQIRKMDALADAEVASQSVVPSDTEEGQETIISRLDYAHCLLLLVCKAEISGVSPYRAACLLDRPPFPAQLSKIDPVSVDATVVSEHCDSARYKESEHLRLIRLQIRQRMFACIRTKKSILLFSNVLLSSWGRLEFKSTSLPRNDERENSINLISNHMSVRKDRPPSLVAINKDNGKWSISERKAFLQAAKTHGLHHWDTIARCIPNRFVP